MRTVKWNPFLSGVCMLLGGVLLMAGTARAEVSSSNPAAIVVFPKIIVDTTTSPTFKVDTIIQLTNTAPNPVNVRCFYVNANGHCSNAPTVICNPTGDPTETASTCGSPFAACQAGWTETDFAFRLTTKQPLVFLASTGLQFLPLSESPGPNAEFNTGSIPGVPENPMIGELKCIEVGDNEQPVNSNDLKGEATIEHLSSSPVAVDISGYNAIGIQAIGTNNGDDSLQVGPVNTSNAPLCAGGDNAGSPCASDADCPSGSCAEYGGCPNILIMDHFFDDAIDPAQNDDIHVRSLLTLVPCAENFEFQAPVTTTVQFLVFNEFEERLSTSRPVTCFLEIPLSDIGTRLGTIDDNQSIFNVGVQGTLTGQTLIRGVGNGLLGVVEELHGPGTGSGFEYRYSAAFNVQEKGVRAQGDVISMPAAQPPSQ